MRAIGTIGLTLLLAACGGGTSATNGSSGALEPGQVATWIRNYGGNGGDPARPNGDYEVADVVAMDDGGSIVAGTVRWGDKDTDAWVARLDRDGGVVWAKTLGEPRTTELAAVQDFVSTGDGGAVVVAWERNGISVVLRIGPDKSLLWKHPLGSAYVVASRICRGLDGGYVVGGVLYSRSAGVYRSQPLLTRFDEQGNKTWSQLQSAADDVLRVTALIAHDDRYTVAGLLPKSEAAYTRGQSRTAIFTASATGTPMQASDPVRGRYRTLAPLPEGDVVAAGVTAVGNDVLVHRYDRTLQLIPGGDREWDPGDDLPCSRLGGATAESAYYAGQGANAAIASSDDRIIVGADDGVLALYTNGFTFGGVLLESFLLGTNGYDLRVVCPGTRPNDVLRIHGQQADGSFLVLTDVGVWTYAPGGAPRFEFELDAVGALDRAEALDADGDGIVGDAFLGAATSILHRFASDGSLVWRYGDSQAIESAHAMAKTDDGVVVLVKSGDRDRLVALDFDGARRWQKEVRAEDREVRAWALASLGSRLAVAGESDDSAWITLLDADGIRRIERAWTRNGDPLSIRDLALTPQGDLLVAGRGGTGAPWLARMSPELTFAAARGHGFWTYAGHAAETSRISVVPTIDEGAILVGSGTALDSSGTRVHVRRIAPDGSVRWMRSIPLDGAGDLPSGACATGDGGCVLAAATTWLGGDCSSEADLTLQQCGNAYVLRIDPDGDVEWSRVYGTGAIDVASAVVPMADGGFLVGGNSRGYRSSVTDVWLLRMDAVGEVAQGCVADLTPDDLVAASEADPTDAVEEEFLPEEFAGAVPEISDSPLASQPLVFEVARSCSGVGTATPSARAKVDPDSLSFECMEGDVWTAAPVTSRVTLRGDWGAAPSLRLVEPGPAVRVRIGGATYDDTAPLGPLTTEFTVEVNRGAGAVPATLELEFLDSDGEPVGGATISLVVECPECSPGEVGPFLFEWVPDSMSNETRIGVSDGSSAVAWSILDAWKSSTGITRVIRPSISPDGAYLAFTAGAVGSSGIYLLDLKAGSGAEPVRITPSAGYDYRDLAWSHAPVTLPGASEASYALVTNRRDSGGEFSLKITLLSVPSDPGDLVAGVSGAGTPISTGTVDRVSPTWSPADTRIAFQDLEDRSLYSVAIDGSDRRLEFDARDLPGGLFKGVNFPTWHPTDDDRIAFHHNGAVYVLRRSSGVVEQYSPGAGRYGAAWTRDGNGILYLEGQANFKLLCGSGGEEASLFGLSGAEINHVRIPRTQAAIDVLNGALGR